MLCNCYEALNATVLKINLSLQVQEFSGANKEKLEETIKSLI